MLAVRYNEESAEAIRILLQHEDPKPDLGIQGDDGWTALLLACFHVNAEVVRMLLEAGADVHQRTNSGLDPLGLCLYSANSENSEEAVQVLQALLESGASVDAIDNVGDAVLHSIQPITPVPAIKILVEADAPVNTVNKRGYNPLGIAIDWGNMKAAEYLIKIEGVRVDVCHPNYGSVLHMAVRSSSPLELTRHLIAAGADYTAVNPATGESVLSYALGREYPPGFTPIDAWYKMLRYLVEELHLDVNARGGKPPYPILNLLKAGHNSNTLKYLIRKGARVDITDELGRGPAHYAAMCTESEATFAAPIKAKADFLLKDIHGRIPLHFVAATSDLDSLKYLLKTLSSSTGGADIDVTDVDSWTPLMWFCRRWGWDETDEMICMSSVLVRDYKANVWVRSKDEEWSPLKIARFHGWSSWWTQTWKVEEDETRQREDGQEET